MANPPQLRAYTKSHQALKDFHTGMLLPRIWTAYFAMVRAEYNERREGGMSEALSTELRAGQIRMRDKYRLYGGDCDVMDMYAAWLLELLAVLYLDPGL